jgi:peptidoglycan-N-acetylglucosamine deacetylase
MPAQPKTHHLLCRTEERGPNLQTTRAEKQRVTFGGCGGIALRATIRSMNPSIIAAPSAIAAGIAAMTAYGAAHPRSQLFGHTISRTDSAKILAITFDDGPNPALTPKLLDLLAKYNAFATFFVVGKCVRESPALVKEIAARGHVIGNHTESHPHLAFCGREETRHELQTCSQAIAQILHEEPRWFRPPFGLRSPWTIDIARQLGMHTAMWTLIPGDWRDKPAEWLIRKMSPIAAHINAQNPSSRKPSSKADVSAGKSSKGDILCLHDGDYARPSADRTATLAALQYWLPRWRDLGLEFVTMSQVFGKAVPA